MGGNLITILSAKDKKKKKKNKGKKGETTKRLERTDAGIGI